MLQNLQGSRARSVAFILIAFALQLLTGKVIAQTDPVAQSLPFNQPFSTLNGTITTYPAGFQGWSVTGSLTTTVLTAPPSGDQGFIASQDNSVTTPFVGDMVGKIGILAGASNVKTLCLALNTTGVSTVQLIYTAATQGQTAGGYIDELDLQYRVPPATNFITIAGATYQNNALSNTNTATTNSSNPATVYVTLPAACGNQSDVELRWIPRNVSGTGTTHPGFSVTNIIAQAQATTDYYCKSTGNLDAVATWGTNADGTGTAPADFLTAAQVFHIANGNTGSLSGPWIVSGAASKIIVDGTDLTIGTNSVVATVDVNAGRTLTISNLNLPTFGVLNSAATIDFLGLTGVVVPVTGIVYPNLIFDNTSVTIPVATQKLSFSGNFTVQNTAAFAMANTTAGYSLLTSGNNNQIITANNIPTTIWTLDVGATNAKTAGTVTIGTNTTLSMDNSITMILTGPAAQFIDGGNTLSALNNLDLSGNAAGYNFTGTLNLNAAGTGSCNIRGGSSGTNPCVGAVNNLNINNSINVKVNPTAGGQTFTVKGALTVLPTAGSGGTVFNFQGNTIAVGGNVAYNNTTDIFTNTGTLLFNGTSAQTYTTSVTGGNTISKVAINNASGLTINSPLNVTSNLNLTNGVITTGSNSLNIGAASTVTVTGTSSYVKGNLSKAMPVGGTTSMVYEVGDATYAPVKLTFGGSVNSGSLSVKSTAGSHPSIAGSFINTGKFVNRYWSITNSGVAPSPATVTVALSYSAAALTSGTDNAGYIVREYASSAWTTAPAETNSTTATAPLQPLASITTGVALASLTGDYVAGAADCSVAAGTVTPTPAFLCGATGTSTLTLTGATTNTGNSYQWQSSPDGAAWSSITGATNATYTPASIPTNTYYMCTVGCIPTGTTVNAVAAVVTVNPVVSAISGASNICQNASTTLSDVDGSGTWVSGSTGVATVVGSTGAVTGVTGGTAMITFTLPDGCTATTVFTVNPLPVPGAITGLATTYVGATTTLSDVPTGGTWTSANTALGTIGSASGIVTGIASGSVIVSYTLSNSCGNTTVTTNVTVSVPFAQGNLVVQQPFNTLNGNSKGINILQYTTSGTLVSSNPLPYSGASRITMSGNATSEGFLSLSLERDRLVVYGYDNDTGTASISSSSVNRVVGSIISSGAFTRQYSQAVLTGASVRGGTAYGNNFYAAGANTGVELMNTPSNISNTFTNCRNLQTYNGNLYVSASTGAFKGVSQVGSGIPTTGGQAEVLLATEASANGPYGFSISPDGNTMYVGSSSVGIMKYTRTGASGPFTVAGYTIYTTPCSGIAVDYTNSVTPTIYATTSAGTSLIKIQDAGSTSASLLTLSTLATTPSTNAFRGVMFAPASYATISGNAAICAGASTNITFNGNPHGTVTYNINGGTNQTIVLDSAKASASIGTGTLTAGNYTYSLVSITTPAGTATVSGSVVVTVNPLPSVITGTTNICVAASTALTDVDAGGTWSNTNTNASVIGSTGVITGQGPGLDTIIYTLPTGCAANITVTINAVPTITSANNGGPLCTGATLNLSVTGASNVTGYAWSGPVAITSPTSASASVPLVTASANGIYTVTLNNGTGIGCTAAYTTAAVTVNTVPSSTGATNSSPICNGGTVTLNDNSSNATAWSWVGSDGFSSSLQSPTATPTVNVTYSLTVSSTGAGCNPSAVYTTIVTVNAVPSSSGVTNDGPICNGGTVNLSAHSSNATAWSWVGSDGFTSSLQNPAATPTVNVTYSLTLSSAGNGCNPSLVYTTNVTVNTVPSSTGATNSSPICNGGTVTLNDHSTNATAWSWVGSDGFTSSLQNPTATPTVNVTYSLTVSSTGNGCNPSAVYTTIVTVNAVPSSSGVTNDGPICKGGTVNLSAHSSNATGWSWVGSDGFTSSLQNPTATPTVNATYSLTVSSAGNGCNPSAVHTTIVTVNVVPSSTGVTNSSPICSGGTVTLSAHSSNATAWSWVGSDGFTSSLQNPMATPTVNVTYSLTVSSAGNGCNPSSVYATIVTVNPAPFSTGPTNSGPICNGGTVTLNDNSANATGWSWVGSDGFTSTLQSPTATPTTTTTYSLTVSGSGTTCASTTTYTTTVAVNLVPSSTGATNSSPICNGGSVTLTAHSSNATAWSWVGSDGFTSSLQNPIATPTVNVTYSLTVSSTGSGCSPSAVHTTIVTVNPVPSSTGATNSSPICNGGNVTLSAHSTNATAWSWVGSDGFTSSLQNPTATPTVNATYSLTVSSSGNGCNPSTPYTTIVTVNAAPSSTGVNNDGPICNGGTVNLSAHSSNATAWSWVGSDGFTSSLQNPTATPTVNATYSLTMSSTGNGCNPPAFYTTIVTVNAVPSSTGATNDGPICNGGTVNLSAHSSNATAWSWIGSDGFTSSLQNPTATPTVNVTYSLTVSSTGNGCSPSAIHTTIITVNAVPSSTGATNSSPICNGGMVTLSAHSSNATAWSWVGSDGFTSSLQNPTATPTVNVTYSLTVSSAGNGCNPSTVYTTIVTVNAAPSSTGATNSSPICNGGTVTLSDHSSNATAWSWVGSDGYTSTLQSPAATPTTTTTYSLTMSSTGNGCSSPVYITVVTVNTVPSSTGATNSSPICNGGAVTLSAHSSNATAWSWVGSDGFTSSLQNPTATPTVNVTYSLTVSSTGNGCNPSTVYTTIVTVNAVPSSTGATNSSPVCNGGAVTLSAHSSNATAWSWIGSDGFTSSLQNPTATPTVNATYSLTVSSTGNGCNPSTVYATIVTVNAAPSSTGATNDGPICNGGTLNLSAHSSNATAWSWVGSDGFTSSQQNPTATPTVNVTYSLTVSSIGNGCSPSTIHTTIVTVNAVPSSTGTTNSGAICNGGTVTLSAHSSNATAWSWVGSDGFTSSQQNPTATPTVNATYSLTVSSTGNGCNPSSVYTTAVTVNTVPSSTGATNSSPICNGGNVILSDNSSNATAWSWVGSDGFTSSLQSPVATPTITTTYSLTVSSTGNGCSPSTVYATIVTVNPLPDAISGSGTVSVGFGTTLSDDISLGTWSSNNGNVTIGSSSGSVSGVTAGTSVITYMLATGCYVTTIMTINAVPPVITGTLTVCVGSGVTLSDAAVGGTWTSGNGNVTIGSSSGAVSGVTAGTSVITYTFPTTGFVTAIVTVNPLPSAILGVGTVCNGSAITLSNTTSGVAWSGSNANATVGGLSGIVTGTNAGTVTITCYILATGCSVQTVVTVNALPDAITGTSQVCLGLQTTLSDAGGGTWTSSNGNATIGSVTGTVTGAIAGTSVITYTLPVTGCTDTAIVTVNPLPGNISGAGHVCAGLAITLSDAGSGSWTSSNAHATVALLSGTVTGATAGTSIITYTLPTTCITTTVVTVDPIVVPGVTLDPATGDTVCSGTTVLFTATPVNGGTTPVYQWKVNTTVTAATSNTYSYEPANGDIVHVLLTSNATCATPVTATVADTMTVIHTDPTSVHISVTPNDTVCLGSTVVFTALGTNSGPSPVYIWSRNGATVASGLVYGYVPANNDNVYCSMVSSLRCKTADTAASNHIVMTVDTAYIPSVEVIVTPGTSIQPGEADTFRAVVSNGGPLISYQWILNTTVLAGATNEMYYGSGFGNSDSMTCVVTSAGPCGYASFNTVKIHVIATGVQQYATGMGDVRLIPNPNKGQFAIKGSLGTGADEEANIEITDMLGQMVYRNKIMTQNGVINEAISLSNTLANGMYMLNLHTANERKVIHFVIEQ